LITLTSFVLPRFNNGLLVSQSNRSWPLTSWF